MLAPIYSMFYNLKKKKKISAPNKNYKILENL